MKPRGEKKPIGDDRWLQSDGPKGEGKKVGTVKKVRGRNGFILVLLCAFLLSGCVTTGSYSNNVIQITETYDSIVEQFIEDWPKLSGVIDGIYEGQTFNVPSGHIEMKKQIDEILLNEDKKLKQNLSAYHKSKAFGLWGSLVTKELIRWITEFRPDIINLVPVGLLVM